MRWVAIIVLVLGVASATARAESAMDATTRAYNISMAAERRATDLAVQRNTLAQRYEDELRVNADLKNQRPSWRRDRELRDALSEANETAKKLAAVTSDLAKAQTNLANARRALVTAIDTELAGNPPAARRAQLDRARAQVLPQAHRAAHRIVLPDMQVDPLADPEELDQQAAAFRESEAELQKQIGGLEAQGKELDRVAMLRKQHDRSNDMNSREDNNPHRNAPSSTGRGTGGAFDSTPTAPSPETGGGAGHDGGNPPPASISSFEADATIVLADVVDTSTLDGLNRAQRTGDPAQRAVAARKTRDAVAAKLDQLRAKRKQIEELAKRARKR
jgi:hypothetical protein